MIGAYSDVVGTAGFLLAAFSVWFTWWSRSHEPEQQVAIRKALKRSEESEQLVPHVRSDIINALQFIEEHPRKARGIVIPKQRIRLAALETTWREARAHVTDRRLIEAMDSLHLESEIAWLELPDPGPDEEVQGRLAVQGERLRAALRRFDEVQ